MANKADVAIIGGGPGGYVAALRAAQLGAKTVLIEKNKVGGVCLNEGCIPTKALLHTASVMKTVREARTFGVKVGKPRLDWATAQARKQKVVDQLVGGVQMLLERAGVEVIKGQARFTSPYALEVDSAGPVEGEKFIIATGSSSITLPIPGLEGPDVLDSSGALALAELPQSILVIGGGAIGVEFASLFNALGVKVCLVEMLSRLLPGLDHDLGGALEWIFSERGIEVHTSAKVTAVEKSTAGLVAKVATADGEREIETQKILSAAGRRPNVEELGLEAAGVRYDRKGAIAVDERMCTNVPHIYAAGDVLGKAMLAHVAFHEGKVAAENALGRESHMSYKAVPNCIFTDPEIASVGLSEEEARQKGYEVRVGRFPFNGNGKALIEGHAEGFVKVVSEARYGEILGLHVVGPHASDLILEGGLALTLEATVAEIEHTIHPHPTLGEAIAEAVLDVEKRPLHLPQ